jgi:hypothetical protein
MPCCCWELTLHRASLLLEIRNNIGHGELENTILGARNRSDEQIAGSLNVNMELAIWSYTRWSSRHHPSYVILRLHPCRATCEAVGNLFSDTADCR